MGFLSWLHGSQELPDTPENQIKNILLKEGEILAKDATAILGDRRKMYSCFKKMTACGFTITKHVVPIKK